MPGVMGLRCFESRVWHGVTGIRRLPGLSAWPVTFGVLPELPLQNWWDVLGSSLPLDLEEEPANESEWTSTRRRPASAPNRTRTRAAAGVARPASPKVPRISATPDTAGSGHSAVSDLPEPSTPEEARELLKRAARPAAQVSSSRTRSARKPQAAAPETPRTKLPRAAGAVRGHDSHSEPWRSEQGERNWPELAGRRLRLVLQRAERSSVANAVPWSEAAEKLAADAVRTVVTGEQASRERLVEIVNEARRRASAPPPARTRTPKPASPPRAGDDFERVAAGPQYPEITPVDERSPLHAVGLASRDSMPAPDTPLSVVPMGTGSEAQVFPPQATPSMPAMMPGRVTQPPAYGLTGPLTRVMTRPEDVADPEDDLGPLAAKIKTILQNEARRHGINV